MRSHDKSTPRGIFAPRGKLMHINGALDYSLLFYYRSSQQLVTFQPDNSNNNTCLKI